MTYTQDNRGIAIEVADLKKDALLLQGFVGSESLSRPFHFSADVLSVDPALALDKIAGKTATIVVKTVDGGERFFSGIVSRVVQRSSGTGLSAYALDIVPRLWLLSRTADCYIFQDKKVTEILEAVFKRRQLVHVEFRLRGTYARLEYCVQYRETDFNFVSRLMEQYGLFYFFEHQRGKHVLVVTDHKGEHPQVGDTVKGGRPVGDRSVVRYQGTQGAANTDADVITDWTMEHEVRSTRFALNDYNFKTPRAHLVSEVPSGSPAGGIDYEIFDYPGEFEEPGAGRTLATIRLEEEDSQRKLFRGSGSARYFTSGYRFTLEKFSRADANTAYVITHVSHQAHENGYMSGASGPGMSYTNSFTCQLATTQFRAPRITPRPVITGPQTAVVVGRAGEEFLVDNFGRVKVQFHWDRVGTRNEKSSCWIRVAQGLAGPRWGNVFLPRVGQEVVVEFLEGDPDRPLIVGTVYNQDNQPPYPLPAEQTKSVIKTNSSKGGGGFNELRFEDRKGSEQVYIHAQKDLDIVVEKDRREIVRKNRHLKVLGNRLEAVDGDQHVKIGAGMVVDVGSSVSQKAGQEIYLKGGTKVVVEAGVEITLKGSGGFIKIDPSGVTVQGTLVRINSGGSAGSGSAKSVTPPDEPRP